MFVDIGGNEAGFCICCIIGVPTEAFAFSNDFRPFLSAPDFSDCAFTVNKNMEISIEMVY